MLTKNYTDERHYIIIAFMVFLYSGDIVAKVFGTYVLSMLKVVSVPLL